MRVLVTGASGRVGRAISVRLLREHEVVGLDRSPSSTAQRVGDVGDGELLRKALRGVDAVVHTAALHAPHVGHLPEAEFERVNVAATRLLLELSIELGVRNFVFTSTTALYGDAVPAATAIGEAAWVDEELVPRPVTVYHRTKLAAESLLERAVLDSAVRESGPAITVLRMSRCFPEAAPLMAAYRLHRGIDARDVAEAHLRALEGPVPGFRRFVVSGSTPFLRSDARALLTDAPAVLARRAPMLVEAFARRGWELPGSIDRIYSPGRARQELGWKARYGFAEVLRMLDEESSEVLPPLPRPSPPTAGSGDLPQ